MRILVHQGSAAEPVEKHGAIRSCQHRAQGVVVAQTRAAIRHGQQMQIVIAKDDRGGIA
jgi:hypothetical protein